MVHLRFRKYTPHYVSAKVALYSHDKRRVLVMHYSHGAYGLPGGHLERHETPNEAIAREFREELGAQLPSLKRADFFFRDTEPDGTLILGYVGTAPKGMQIVPSDPKHEMGEWLTRTELQDLNIAPGYREFIIRNWP